MSGRISRTAAIENLQKFYGANTTDSITIDEILVNTDRTDKSLKTNRSFIYNKLSSMREHKLFTKEFGVRNNVKFIKSLRLTPEGRKALGRDRDTPSTPPTRPPLSNEHRPTFDTVKADVKKLQADFPALEITYRVELKEDEMA